jgi:hypothetical protein
VDIGGLTMRSPALTASSASGASWSSTPSTRTGTSYNLGNHELFVASRFLPGGDKFRLIDLKRFASSGDMIAAHHKDRPQ